jgi:hypothetical protein
MHISHLALAPLLYLVITAPAFAEAMTDDAIRRTLIRESIAGYSGNCPCPDNLASNGSRCGKRSAWNRAGGDAPLCYPEDVSFADVAAYRAEHGELGIQEIRGGSRSSGGGSRSYSGGWRSSSDWARSYSGRTRSEGRLPAYKSSLPEVDETDDLPEPPSPTRSLELVEPTRVIPRVIPEAPVPALTPEPQPAKPASKKETDDLPEPPPPTRSLELVEPTRVIPEAPAPALTPEPQPAKPASKKKASTRQRTAKPEVQQLPDCPPGTSLAQWNGQNICVGIPEGMARPVEPVTTDQRGSSGENQASGESADVLSRLQATASASGQPVTVPMGQPRESLSAPPAAGLLNCTGGTRVTYVNGRIECR